MESNQLRFLESAENVKALVHLRTGRGLSTTRAKEICACIRQGRQYLEASVNSPLDIRPLIQFYGVLNFARAIVLGDRLCSISALARGHGLRDVSASDAPIAGLTARVEASGTFVEFNNTVSALNRLCYLDANSHPAMVIVPTTMSAPMLDMQITLKDVLARVPTLSGLYRNTFAEPAETEQLDHLHYDHHGNYWTTRVFGSDRAFTREGLREMLGSWRSRFPYLERWRVIEAVPAYGKAYITLANLERGETDDLSEQELLEYEPGHYRAQRVEEHGSEASRIPLDQLFLGVGGGYSNGAYAIAPYGGCYLSEFSLAYVGLYLLSSLVRYRPDAWVHAVSRSSLQDRPVDDQALALIHAFLETTHESIPRLAIKALNPHEDRYA